MKKGMLWVSRNWYTFFCNLNYRLKFSQKNRDWDEIVLQKHGSNLVGLQKHLHQNFQSDHPYKSNDFWKQWNAQNLVEQIW